MKEVLHLPFNPVRQYNKYKPQTYRVDFFALCNCNNSLWQYFIVHCDIYQGKNSENIGIPTEIHNLPTTQKAAVNVIIQPKLGKEPNGIRLSFMDNRYDWASLFILLCKKWHPLCWKHTSEQNRMAKGWDESTKVSTKRDINTDIWQKK